MDEPESLSHRNRECKYSVVIGFLPHFLFSFRVDASRRLRASEQKREDVQRARSAWRQALPTMDVGKLVLIDETWTSTSMTRR